MLTLRNANLKEKFYITSIYFLGSAITSFRKAALKNLGATIIAYGDAALFPKMLYLKHY